MQMYGNSQYGSSADPELIAHLTTSLRNIPPPVGPTADNKGERPPLEVLPPAARELIEQAETAFGIHPSYSLAGMIFATAAAVGATHRVQIKPGSLQSPCFYMAMVGTPNSNKSGGLKFALNPIQERDDENYRKYQRDLIEYREAVQLGQAPEVPRLEKTIMVEYSREAIAAKHLENLRGLAVNRDELSGWFADFNRYGGGGEEAFWLSNWSGNPISVDLKSQNTIRIHNPVISVAGTIQPGPLKSIFTKAKSENGFSDRVLFAWPEIQQKADWNEYEIPAALTYQYAAAIERLQAIGFNTVDSELGEGWLPKETPHVIPFSKAGQRLMLSFFNSVNNPLCDFAENDRLKGMHGKFDIHAPRLALALQMLWHGYGEGGRETITEDMTGRALLLTEWFRSQSMKVYRYLHESGPLDDLPGDEQRIYNQLLASFSSSEAVFTAKATAGFSKRKTQAMLKSWKDANLVASENRGNYSKFY
jgi:hypothetical protein